MKITLDSKYLLIGLIVSILLCLNSCSGIKRGVFLCLSSYVTIELYVANPFSGLFIPAIPTAGDKFIDYYWNTTGMKDGFKSKNNLKIVFIILTIVFLQYACEDNSFKDKYHSTEKISNELFCETYYDSYSIISEFITDSSTFKVYIGSFDYEVDEYFHYFVKGDTLIVIKYQGYKSKRKELETRIYSIKSFKYDKKNSINKGDTLIFK